MKRLLQPTWMLRLWTLGLCLVLGFALVAQAPTPANTTTNAPAALERANAFTESQRAFIEENRSLLTFGLDQIPALQFPILQRPLWQYLATLLYILIAFYVAKFVDWLIHSRLRKWAVSTENQWDDILVNLVDGPVKVVVFVILLNLGLQLFDWPGVIEGWFTKVTILAVGFSVLLVVLKAVDAGIALWRRSLPSGGDRDFNEHFLVLVGKVIKGVIVVVAIFTVLGNLGFDIRTALASVSVVGLALGLAAQDTVGNLFGAVAVFLDKPFKIGDRVQIGEVDGTVEEMGLRSTRIRNLEGFLVTVPNKEIGTARIVNISRRPTIRTIIGIGLTYDTPAPKVRRAVELIQEIFQAHPNTHDVVVYFNRFGDSALNIEIVYWCRTTVWKEYTQILQALNLELKARFDGEGLSFAFPTRTIQLQTSSAGKLDTNPAEEALKLPMSGSTTR